MKKHLAAVFWWTVAALLVLWPLGLCLAGEARPAATAEDWLRDPEGAQRAVTSQASALMQIVQGMSLTEKILAGLGMAVAVLRCTPAWGPLIGVVWDLAAPKSTRQAEQLQAVQAQGFKLLVKTVQALPVDGTLGELRDKLARKMPDSVKGAVEAYLETLPPVVAAPVTGSAVAPTA